MIKDAMNKPKGNRAKALAWLFYDYNADSREAVCDLAGIDPEFFNDCLPRIRDIIEHVQMYGEYEEMKPKEVAKYISKMFMRHSRDETTWRDV
jgi:hypothetical protein